MAREVLRKRNPVVRREIDFGVAVE